MFSFFFAKSLTVTDFWKKMTEFEKTRAGVNPISRISLSKSMIILYLFCSACVSTHHERATKVSLSQSRCNEHFNHACNQGPPSVRRCPKPFASVTGIALTRTRAQLQVRIGTDRGKQFCSVLFCEQSAEAARGIPCRRTTAALLCCAVGRERRQLGGAWLLPLRVRGVVIRQLLCAVLRAERGGS